MAALQTIRSKGALLVGVLGLALFAFIAEEFFRSLETTSNMDKNVVGEVYGEKLSIQDFQTLVEERSQIAKFTMMMQGQSGNLSDEQTEQIRQQVWQEFVQNKMVEHECDKLGIIITDKEVQEALRQGTSQSLQMLASIFGNQQTGRFELAYLQQFLKEYDKNIKSAQQSQNSEAVEQLQMVKKLWDYSEKQLRSELLSNKYNAMFAMGFISNPVAAKESFDGRTITKNVEIAALPYTAIADKDVKVTDDDLKAAYDELKENFYSPVASADIKYIDKQVVPSAADHAELMKKVQEYQAQLENGADVANIVRASGSEVTYTTLPLSKNAYNRLPGIGTALDSMGVGSVKPAFYNGSDNTINTIKLIAKQQAPDSILLRAIPVNPNVADKGKAQADSILNALNGGAKFADIAQKYGVQSDSSWMTTNQYESFGVSDDAAKFYAEIWNIPAGTNKVVTTDQATMVVQVLDRKNITTRYQAAVVKCKLNFSKATYESELSKFNRFLAANNDTASIEKNAAKEGYMLQAVSGYSPTNNIISQRIGGSQAKDCDRWIFDDADAGDVSKLYECGKSGDHLLLVLVSAKNKKGILPLSNPDVKAYVTSLATQNKKAQKALELAKSVKTTADMQKVKGNLTATLTSQSFSGYPVVTGVNVYEPKLAGAIAQTGVNKYSGLIQGSGAVYIVKVTSQQNNGEKFDANKQTQEQLRVANTIGQRAYSSTFNYLINQKADLDDRRYEF